jgi:hypothetical protein
VTFCVIYLFQIPDITSDIEQQLQGHETYRRRLAMARAPHQHQQQQQQQSSETFKSNLVEKSQNLHQLPEVPSPAAHVRALSALMFWCRMMNCG